MIPAELDARLREALGEGGVAAGGVEVDGAKPDVTLLPADAEALSRCLALLSAAGRAALVRGGGNRLGLGNPPRAADAVLSLERQRGIEEFDPGEGVCRVRAGSELAAVRSAVNAGGWELPFDAPGAGATVGGTLAAAAVGPRALGFGRPRDLVLGLEVVMAGGERTRCGGRVVKNVTGYDLGKLYTGSLGTLGVISAAWLRLRPRPDRVSVWAAWLADAGYACAAGLEAARRATCRASVVAVPGTGAADGDCQLVVELAGEAAAVARDGDWLESRFGAAQEESAALDRLRRAQLAARGEPSLRFRLDARPSRQSLLVARLREARADLLVHAGLQLVYAAFPAEVTDPTAIEGAWRAAREAARAAGGGCVLEHGPLAAKLGRDVFGDPGAASALTRALKDRFDPGGVLNPGRFLGGA